MNYLKQWIDTANETLLDLIFGCMAFSIIMELMGLLLAADKLAFTIGLFMGTVVAIGVCLNMSAGIADCLSMEAEKAKISMAIKSVIRWIVMLVVAWIGIKVKYISFAGVILGMFGLKFAAHFHVYTHIYITNKIRKKGR